MSGKVPDFVAAVNRCLPVESANRAVLDIGILCAAVAFPAIGESLAAAKQQKQNTLQCAPPAPLLFPHILFLDCKWHACQTSRSQEPQGFS